MILRWFLMVVSGIGLGGWVVVGFGLGLRFEFVGFVVFGLELVLRYFR